MALHELFHTLGAVQPTAPNGTAGFHCTDEHDVLCYDDGSLNPGQSLVQRCGYADDREPLDCGGDDYFSVQPAPGSYLATRWNTARSMQLFEAPQVEVPIGRVDSMWYAAGAAAERPSVLANDLNLSASP